MHLSVEAVEAEVDSEVEEEEEAEEAEVAMEASTKTDPLITDQTSVIDLTKMTELLLRSGVFHTKPDMRRSLPSLETTSTSRDPSFLVSTMKEERTALEPFSSTMKRKLPLLL